MKTLELTNGGVTLVDEWWYTDLLCLGPWESRPTGYVVTCGEFRLRNYLHRVVLEMGGHDLAGLDVDHINGNRLDNRLCNLRPATRRQNTLNRRRHQNNTSGYVGVFWKKQTGRWATSVTINGRQKHLGYFDDPAEAARVRDLAILAAPDAEFVTLNFPELRPACP